MKERRLGLQDVLSKTKPPVIQFTIGGHWRVWTAYNPELTLGTYIQLEPDGSMRHTIVNPDFSETLQWL